jgi:hypothetical protein
LRNGKVSYYYAIVAFNREFYQTYKPEGQPASGLGLQADLHHVLDQQVVQLPEDLLEGLPHLWARFAVP